MEPDTKPVISPAQKSVPPQTFQTSRWVIWAFGILGLTLVAVAVLFLLVAKDKVWGLVLISLPCGLVGLWMLTRLPGLIRAKIVIDGNDIYLRIPVWASGLLRKGSETRIQWDEILRLTHTIRIHYPFLIPMAVEEYTLHTAKGQSTITKNIIPKPERVMAIISARTGKLLEELPS
jgi:hypothetical protein